MPRTLSLTRRLTLYFTVACALLVLALGLLFMAATQQHFIELDDQALHDKQHLVAELLATSRSPEQARRRLSEALNHHQGLYARVEGAATGLLFQSAGPDLSLAEDPGTGTGSGSDWRRLQFEVQAGFSPAPRLQVRLALGTEHHRHFMAGLLRSLAVYALIATLAGGLLAWLAAHQGLAPLRAMKARAAAVTGQRLGERMPVEAVPVEMADLARELNRMLDRLQQDFQRLSDFSSDLAHELRTPINNLLTQTQVALAHPRAVATYRDILASNAEEFERLGRMVADMLLLAKTEHGVDLPRMERFSILAEARALVEFHDAVAEDRRVRLVLQGEGELVGDRLMFRRALSNLLSNALRHAHPDSTLRIQIGQTAQGCTVKVENQGDTIPAEALPRLFDRFYRVDPARSHDATDGAGLGLPITRAIVEAHGGQVSVASSQGLTVFTLAFPGPAS